MAGPETVDENEHAQAERFEPRDRAKGKPRPNGDGASHEHGHANVRPEIPRPASAKADTEHSAHEQIIPDDLPRPSNLAVALALIIVAALLIAVFILGWVPYHHRQQQARADASAQASDLPVVSVQHPTATPSSRELRYPCDVRANQATALFARTNGYLKKWNVDILDHVKEGQVLAEIDAPEIDAQLAQSRANLEQSKANVSRAQADLSLADVTLKRFIEAQKESPGSVIQSDIDQKRAAFEDAASALAQAKANVVAGEADVQRLSVTQGFDKIIAPFDGVITARNYDNGALISATNTSAGGELFDIQQTSVLRVFVNVPQAEATAVQIGKPVFLTVQNYPGREFQGTVARSSGSLNQNTRTLTVELDFPNKDEALYAGMYGQVRFPISNAATVLIIPTSALIYNADGLKVATVQGDKAHVQNIQVGRDLGTSIEVTTGLVADDQIITNPGEKIVEGVKVKVSQPKPNNPPGK